MVMVQDEATAGVADQAGMGNGADKVSVVVLTHVGDVSCAVLRQLLCAVSVTAVDAHAVRRAWAAWRVSLGCPITQA